MHLRVPTFLVFHVLCPVALTQPERVQAMLLGAVPPGPLADTLATSAAKVLEERALAELQTRQALPR